MSKKFDLVVSEWEGHPRCVYLNNFRIVGRKPWGGGRTLCEWKLDPEELCRAIPGLSYQAPEDSSHD